MTLQAVVDGEERPAGGTKSRLLPRQKIAGAQCRFSSPGSGKTTFIRETAAKLAGRLRVGVIVGDLATDNDAARLRTAGIPVVQITTGTVCHLDADMVSKAAAQLDLDKT